MYASNFVPLWCGIFPAGQALFNHYLKKTKLFRYFVLTETNLLDIFIDDDLM